MSLYSIIVVNTSPGCDNLIEQQINVGDCQNVIVRITPNTNAEGPFDVYVNDTGSTPVYSSQTRTEMLNGVIVDFPCSTPTPTPSPTITPTSTPLPTPTPTPGLYYGYLFAEPQTEGNSNTLLSWATLNGANEWGSWFSVGLPNNNAGNYSNDLNVYAHQPSFSGGGDFVSPQLLKGKIAQYNGEIINGVSQSIHTFGSIEVNSDDLNPNIKYFYSIWIPLIAVGGSLNDMTIDVGTTLGDYGVYDNIPTITGLTSLNVTVTPGAVVPSGTYRVLWVSPNFELPISLPFTGSLFFRGDTKI